MPRGSSIELAREMVEEVDKNGDGRVDYHEVGDSGATLPALDLLMPCRFLKNSISPAILAVPADDAVVSFSR